MGRASLGEIKATKLNKGFKVEGFMTARRNLGNRVERCGFDIKFPEYWSKDEVYINENEVIV